MAVTASSSDRFCHLAVFYHGPGEYLAALRGFPDLVLAISELAANTVRHTDSGGTLQVWQTGGKIICQVADTGHLTDPLAWHRPPSDELLSGNGLWLVNQVCDLVQARTGQAGTTIRLHMRLNGHSPRRHASRQTH